MNESLIPEATQEGQEGTAVAQDATQEPTWSWGENLPGEGDAPEWLKSDKYKTVADQAKAYSELEKKFGGFKGAPKDGYAVPEGADSTDERLDVLKEFAEGSNMSQETFNKAWELIVGNDEGSAEAELAALGENATERLDRLSNQFGATLPPEVAEQAKKFVTSADAVMLAEILMAQSKQPSLPREGQTQAGRPTQEDVDRLMTEKDANGRVIYHHSKARQDLVQQTIAKMIGE